MSEWLEPTPEINEVQIDNVEGSEFSYTVGKNDVTKIEAFEKSGLHSNIPYVRVYRFDKPAAEFCQHQIVGVYFKVQP